MYDRRDHRSQRRLKKNFGGDGGERESKATLILYHSRLMSALSKYNQSALLVCDFLSLSSFMPCHVSCLSSRAQDLRSKLLSDLGSKIWAILRISGSVRLTSADITQNFPCVE